MRGIWAALLSSLIYTLTNGLLRWLATDVDPLLPSAMKATVTLLFFLPAAWVAAGAGRRLIPGPRGIALLVVVSVINQLVGNVGFQYSLGILGIALTVPLCTGSMVIGSVLLGRILLREPVGRGLLVALVILTASVFLFRGGAQDARDQLASAPLAELRQWSAMAGVAVALLSGLAYAIMSVTIRAILNRDLSRLTPILSVVAVGTLILWPGVFWRMGMEGLAGVSSWQWMAMGVVGVGNALGFLFLTTSLQHLPVAWVNAINVSQVGMAALGGLLCFGEPASLWFWIGLATMGAGFWILFQFGSAVGEKRHERPASGGVDAP